MKVNGYCAEKKDWSRLLTFHPKKRHCLILLHQSLRREPPQRHCRLLQLSSQVPRANFSRGQRARKDKQQESRQKVLGTQYQCAESDREAKVSHQGLIKFRVPNPPYITAMPILNEFQDAKDAPLKGKLLLKYIITAVPNRAFDSVIGDQFSRLATRFPKSEAPPASSDEPMGTPLDHLGPEEHKINTDDEHSDSDDRLTTESNPWTIARHPRCCCPTQCTIRE